MSQENGVNIKRTMAAIQQLKQTTPWWWPAMSLSMKRNKIKDNLPPPSEDRLGASLCEESYKDLGEYLEQAEHKRGTVLYLAYGSNLSKETFRGNRGIKPLSQINVQVPSLRLTFDLSGLPYGEPCFANTAKRDPEKDNPSLLSEKTSHVLPSQVGITTPLLQKPMDYHKNRWHKGLIGVVYEVTPSDYAHIIATEGGGASYQDVLVDCYPFSSSDPSAPVPQDPTSLPFKAHTLFAPADRSEGNDSAVADKPRVRPDPSYAQPSPRYLKLITDGAAELGLPYEYQSYLQQIRPYRATTTKQRLGQFIFLAMWMPFVMAIFQFSGMFADDKGRAPAWLKALLDGMFTAVWGSYDGVFKPMFGDGERTIEDGGKEESESDAVVENSWTKSLRQRSTEGDLEKHGSGRS